jgi:quercetin dioxygenase-like cupin family protein
MKTHIKGTDIPYEKINDSVTRQMLGYDSQLMLVKVCFQKGGIGYAHQHPHQQVSYVASGKFEIEIDENKEILSDGDCFVVPGNAVHGVICLEEGVLIDTFSPMREDFLKNSFK